MTQFFLILIIINSLMFMTTKHPMSMGLILMMQTIFTCTITGLCTKTFWFSYTLFLILIGGMLILFIYMASLASNEKFSYMTITFKSILMIMFLLLIFFYMDNFWFNNFLTNTESILMKNSFLLIKENYLAMSKMYDTPNNWMSIFLISYLLLTLIIVVKISNLFKGPIRSHKN